MERETLREELRKLEEDERDIYAEIGRKALKMDGMLRYSEFKERLETLEDEISHKKQILAGQGETASGSDESASGLRQNDMKVCFSCGEKVEAGQKFCIKCGVRLTGMPDKCPRCGLKLTEPMAFCIGCGLKL